MERAANAFGALCGWVWIHTQTAYGLLFWAMVADFATGLMSSYNRDVSITSRHMTKGLFVKVAKLIAVALSILLGDQLPSLTHGALNSAPLGSAVVGAFVATEFLSVVENLAGMGVRLPDSVLKAIGRLSPARDETQGE